MVDPSTFSCFPEQDSFQQAHRFSCKRASIGVNAINEYVVALFLQKTLLGAFIIC